MSGRKLTPNEVVAYNLRRARQVRRMTQEEAGRAMEPILGVAWSKESWSQAERSYTEAGRARQFDADELYAFAKAFDLPIGWFLVPPAPEDGEKLRVAPSSGSSASLGEFIEAVIADRDFAYWERLQEVFEALPQSELSVAQDALERQVNAYTLSRMAAALRDLPRWRATLQELQDGLEEAEQQARAGLSGQVEDEGAR